MKVTAEKNEQVAKMTFASVQPHYINRLEKNGRTKEDLHEVIEWQLDSILIKNSN